MLSKNSRRKKIQFYFEVCFSFHGHRRTPQLVSINWMNNITKSFENSKKWKYKYNQKPVENEDDIKEHLRVFNVVTMQKVLVKWICLHCTIAVSHVF